MTPYILTEAALTVVLNGVPRSVAVDEPEFQNALEAVRNKRWWQIPLILESREKRLAAAAKKAVGSGITVEFGEVKYLGTVVHNSLTTRMLELLDKGFDLRPMAAFLANLMKNPSYRAVQDLYTFLETGGIPITEDGCFMAYKAINKNWTDIYSGKFDNSIGATVRVDRNTVDEDPNRTCSRGLHVCSFGYLPHFAHADGHVVAVKVNPADVVAIPADYKNTKMRVSAYTVVSEVKDYYKNNTDVLRGVGVYGLVARVVDLLDDFDDADFDDDDDSDCPTCGNSRGW